MPESRKRAGHTYQKRADVPSSQRTTGHLLWAVLIGVFGAMMGYFALNGSMVGLVAGLLAGAGIGWWIGRKMEQDVSGK